MKKYLVFGALFMLILPAFGSGRSTVGNTLAPGRSVVVASKGVKPVSDVVSAATEAAPVENENTGAVVVSNTTGDNVDEPVVNPVDIEKERQACLRNNIGVDNAFVWAAKDSNTSSYSTMVEDVEHPENNTCFVLIGMRSQDSRISVADIQPMYFEWDKDIECGSWVDKDKMEERILDAKKSARVWGTVAGSVGGAGVGVGAMELFGNRLISGAVQGQDNLTMYSVEWYRSKINENMKDEEFDYDNFEDLVSKLVEECNGNSDNPNCTEPKYKGLIEWYNTDKK